MTPEQVARLRHNIDRVTASQVEAQRKWIETHGGNLTGYVARYGSVSDPNHFGNGGEAIYRADLAELHRLERLHKNQAN